MWPCLAILLNKSRSWLLSQHNNSLSLQTRTQIYGQHPSQIAGRQSGNTNRGDQIFLGCHWRRTVLRHRGIQTEWFRRTDAWRERAMPESCWRMGSKWGTIFIENQHERSYKDWRRLYVVSHEWSQSKSTNTSRPKSRSDNQEVETQITRPTLGWSATDNRYKH